MYDILGFVGKVFEGIVILKDVFVIEGVVEYFYVVVNIDICYIYIDFGVLVIWWCLVGYFYNGFVVEIFMDEFVYEVGVDFYQFC